MVQLLQCMLIWQNPELYILQKSTIIEHMRKSQYDPGGDVMSRLNNLYKKMIEYYRGNPQQIQHLTKVHSFAKLIGEEEHLDERTLYILEAAAYVHDIGIRPAMEKYGRDNGPSKCTDLSAVL